MSYSKIKRQKTFLKAQVKFLGIKGTNYYKLPSGLCFIYNPQNCLYCHSASLPISAIISSLTYQFLRYVPLKSQIMLFWLFFCSVLILTELRNTVSSLLNIHSVVLVRLTMNSSCIQYFRVLFKKFVFYASLSNEACLLFKSLVYHLKLFCPYDSQLLRKKSAFLTM